MTDSDLDVRVLEAKDAAAYFALRKEMLEDSPASFGSSPKDSRLKSVEATAEALESHVIGVAFLNLDLKTFFRIETLLFGVVYCRFCVEQNDWCFPNFRGIRR
jgi:hypothetical protein